LTFVLVLAAFTVLGMWVAIGARSGIWNPGFLVLIPAITFFFAILYSVSALMGVLTRSPIVCILVTVAFWFGMWVTGSIHGALEQFRKDPMVASDIPAWLTTTVDTVH